jgi:hypothetical protein
MRVAVALAFLAAAGGCTWEMSLGRGDGVQPYRFEEDVENPARSRKGEMLVTREVELISAERSQKYRDSFGPDRIGALRAVSLTITEVRVDGADLDLTGPPDVGILGHPMRGVPGEVTHLDDFQVDWVRKQILAGEAVTGPLSFYLPFPEGTLDDAVPSLHIVLVLQPTLIVDAARSL